LKHGPAWKQCLLAVTALIFYVIKLHYYLAQAFFRYLYVLKYVQKHPCATPVRTFIRADKDDAMKNSSRLQKKIPPRGRIFNY
jgi:hypothetical protein